MITDPEIRMLVSIHGSAFWVVFLRTGFALMVMPGLGEQVLAARIKLVLALLSSLVITPIVIPQLTIPDPNFGFFVRSLFTEAVSGLFLGLMLRFFILAVQTSGSIAAQSTSLSQLMGNAGLDPLPAIGHLLTIACLALLMITGFHVRAIEYLAQSYSLLPALSFPNPRDIAAAGSAQAAKSFFLALQIAIPFVMVSLIYNLTLGVINKAMPQLMVAFVGAPVITFGAIAVLFVSAPLMLLVWLREVQSFLTAPAW